jgi:hypothetical protein
LTSLSWAWRLSIFPPKSQTQQQILSILESGSSVAVRLSDLI